MELYKNYLGEPFGQKAPALLRTHFEVRERM
ncbi:iron hydrogenase small subunit [Desulfotomaculum sp. 1211_IL3151]